MSNIWWPVFLYLDPQNQAAVQIVTLPVNARFKHTRPDKTAWLRIGIDHDPKNLGQLISFGCDSTCCDIILRPGFAQRQCHLFIHPRTGELLLRDDTTDHSTEIFGSNDPLEHKFRLPDTQPRQRVLLAVAENVRIKMKDALFKVNWSERLRAFNAAKMMPMITQSVAHSFTRADHVESGRIVHRRVSKLGKGATATVFLTLNLKTGDQIAVKIFNKFKTIAEEMESKKYVKREVDLMSRLSHVRFLIRQSFLGSMLLIYLPAEYSCLPACPRLGIGSEDRDLHGGLQWVAAGRVSEMGKLERLVQ